MIRTFLRGLIIGAANSGGSRRRGPLARTYRPLWSEQSFVGPPEDRHTAAARRNHDRLGCARSTIQPGDAPPEPFLTLLAPCNCQPGGSVRHHLHHGAYPRDRPRTIAHPCIRGRSRAADRATARPSRTEIVRFGRARRTRFSLEPEGFYDTDRISEWHFDLLFATEEVQRALVAPHLGSQTRASSWARLRLSNTITWTRAT